MQAHHTKAIVSEKGSLTIDQLPFPAGKAVEVVVFLASSQTSPESRYPLRGTPIQFDDPTGSMAEADWESLP
jgi:hypothetical protein